MGKPEAYGAAVVFPASAGMNRRSGNRLVDLRSVPRKRGDEPSYTVITQTVRASGAESSSTAARLTGFGSTVESCAI